MITTPYSKLIFLFSLSLSQSQGKWQRTWLASISLLCFLPYCPVVASDCSRLVQGGEGITGLRDQLCTAHVVKIWHPCPLRVLHFPSCGKKSFLCFCILPWPPELLMIHPLYLVPSSVHKALLDRIPLCRVKVCSLSLGTHGRSPKSLCLCLLGWAAQSQGALLLQPPSSPLDSFGERHSLVICVLTSGRHA